MTETESLIALNMIPQVGPVRLRKLMGVFGSASAVLNAGTDRLANIPGIPREMASNIGSWENRIDLQAELERVREFGAEVITGTHPLYPRQLSEIHDPPLVLYVWGKLTAADQLAIAVVGSRKTSQYGIECAKKLSYQLAYAGCTVISGLARGIDTAAHQSALAAKGRTVAVIGSGLMELYPPENQALAERIIESGAVVSEFSMATPPDRQTFPIRNRIISGWSHGLLVVEAGLNSGALISANQALDQGRTVYAVPGQINRPTSTGTNRLIQQGARLVTDASDIIEDLQALLPRARKLEEPTTTAEPEFPFLLSPEQKAVFDAIGDEETAIDLIIEKSGLPTPRVSSTLLALEMKRLVRQLPGKHFIRNAP